ncbi:MAG: DUF2249 domain-containing protein [Candidatus Competibacteraceae bacterium]|nr:DUF2249 domain-containing protein [Candidatus Competibacteraceae bacterium]MCP5459860.1 DUF2249 domain-containing protein [Gammaproteobacteria bacterium]MCB1770036.1 DUF2249 domain-containing protein [Candidatus Competibacteraceae bacterium]MCB1780047.1 DUF2249 domain-containing protein [Candidatus Competibacteraceae bacterium]HPF58588.1 DUF2249 domain-containing protein [Candidatus Competibacteraceae bacterium]
MNAPDDLIVDGRGLQPPEPMEQVVAALDILQSGQRIRFLIHRQPYPLYDLLSRHHYRYETTSLAEGGFEVLISAP